MVLFFEIIDGLNYQGDVEHEISTIKKKFECDFKKENV